ncbi:hypothetical protein L1987_32955 [Smallanthus sonchifolius]|uniref:Uncharacterized protein n=1 Tax=Smallanthus sonchifolius TaxID=185202 RepID=A0ACB9HPF5_9ASTR|nr:hypothetical protein L1987_32955 [Smallanthus sonchifolius]
MFNLKLQGLIMEICKTKSVDLKSQNHLVLLQLTFKSQTVMTRPESPEIKHAKSELGSSRAPSIGSPFWEEDHKDAKLWHRHVTPSVSPSIGKGHIICIASSFLVTTLGESPEHHPLPFEGSKTEPSEESLKSPSPVGYGGLSQDARLWSSGNSSRQAKHPLPSTATYT